MRVYQFDHPVRIVNLGDLHRGNYNCDAALLQKNIDIIKDDPHTYWVSTGDMLETATKGSKSSCYEAISPEKELEALASELKPIKKKCLGFVASNHHNRVEKESGIKLDKVLADRARIPFLGISAVIKVVCGRCAYFIAMHHGVGGGTDGNKVNRAMKLAQNWLGCDLYLTGHTHTYSMVPDIQTLVDRKRDKLTKIITYHVTTGHYINYDDSYAEVLGLSEKPRGSAAVSLGFADSGNQAYKKVTVDFLN